jgi:CMP/dCMP kinase
MNQQKINIAIDGLTATGKSSVGQEVSERLSYEFIDSRLFYRYFAKIYYRFGKEELIEKVNETKQDIINDPKKYLKKLNHLFDLSNEDFLKYGKRASEIAKYEELRQLINDIIREITREKGFVVVGRDTTTNILPKADIKMVLEADFVKRIDRRKNQLISSDEQNSNLDLGKIISDMMDRDEKASSLIHEAEKVSIKIDTTDLEFDQVVEKIISMIFWRVFHIKYDKYFRVLFVFIIIFIYKIINLYI